MAARGETAWDAHPSAAVGSPQFVGRTREFAALGDALTAAPALVLIEGEAGIGKSRLIQEFFASPAGRRHRALVAACPPFREPYTLAPVVDAVRHAAESVRGLPLSGLAGVLRPLFPEWVDDLPPAPEYLDDATAARHRLFRAFVELIFILDADLLVVEDVHWADEATLDFLMFVLARRPPVVSLILTYRPEDVPPGSLLLRLSSRAAPGVAQRRMVLGPLDTAETAAFVSSMLAGAHVSRRFAGFLQERTEGVPLALEESVRLMHERSDLARQNGAWVRRRLDHIEVPPTIRDAVLERVARLGPATQAVLDAAAVLSEPADHQTMAALAGVAPDRVDVAIVEALRCGLLREDGRGFLSFRHSLACRAVYEAIPSPQRSDLHLRAGSALEALATPPLAQLARHFREAGQTDAWCRYAEQAADRAIETGDEASAAALLHNVVTAVTLASDHLVRLVRKIQYQYLPGPDPFTGVAVALRRVLSEPGMTPVREAAVRFQLGRLFMVSGALEAGRREMRRAVAHLPPDSLEAARARVFLAIPVGNVQAATEHLRWLRDAPQLASSVAKQERLLVRADRIVALLVLGEEEGWVEAELIPEEPSAPEEVGHLALAHLNLAHAAMLWGRYPEARRRLARALELADCYTYVRDREAAAAHALQLDWFTGEWDGLVERAGALADQDDVAPGNRRQAALVAGWMHVVAGDQRRAEDRLRDAAQDDQQRIDAVAALAMLMLREGRIEEAVEATDGPMDVTIGKQIWPYATEVAPVRMNALVAAGRIDQAARLVAEFAAAVGGRAAPAARASIAVCRAILAEARGEYVDAAGLFEAAAAAWRELPRPYEALRARERAARCRLAARQEQIAVSELSAVLSGFQRLGASHDAEAVSRTLRDLGISTERRRGGRPGYGGRLSPRELEVARLLVGGRTNRQIADALVVSTPTVASHLQSAMRKLGVLSRTALALKLVELGLVEQDSP